MRDYVILTDSCCDLPAELAAELELTVLPPSVRMDNEEYTGDLAGSGISHASFYARLRAGEKASTAAVNVGQYEEAMRGALQSGRDVVCINFSSALSSTHHAAQIAAQEIEREFPEGHIFVVDSLCASLGQGLLLYLAAQKKREGVSAEALADWAGECRRSVCHWFTVDDLNYLKQGGRINAATAMLGAMLAIKPILHMSDEGTLTLTDKTRGRKPSLLKLIDEAARRAVAPETQTMFICHGDCAEEANWLAEQLKARLHVPRVIVNYIGPVIGSHTGPNTVGLFFLGTER